MQRRYIRMGQLASTPKREGMLPVSAPTIWRWVRDKQFPEPVRLGPQTTAWPVEAVEKWLAERSATRGVFKPRSDR